MRFFFRPLLVGLLISPLLAGCDQLGIETPAQTLLRQEAEGKAIGSACRQTGRALEDCYARAQKDKKNKYITKAAIFNGWKEMDAYMRENNLATVTPPPDPEPVPVPAAAEGENAGKEGDAKGTEGADKPGEGKPGKPETKVDAPAELKPKGNGKISAHLAGATFA